MDNYSKLCDESQVAGPTFGDVKLGGTPSNDTEVSLSARAPKVVVHFISRFYAKSLNCYLVGLNHSCTRNLAKRRPLGFDFHLDTI